MEEELRRQHIAIKQHIRREKNRLRALEWRTRQRKQHSTSTENTENSSGNAEDPGELMVEDDNQQMMESSAYKEILLSQHDEMLLPPDLFRRNEALQCDEMVFGPARRNEARHHYDFLREHSPQSNRTKRKYVFGSFHQHLFPGFHLIDGHESSRLVIKLAEGGVSNVLITFCGDATVVEAVNNLGKSLLPQKGNCANSRQGDLGDMFAFGIRNSSTGVEYVTSKGKEPVLLEASRKVADFAESVMPEVLVDIQTADERKGAPQPAYIDARVGKSTIISRDYGNATHNDYNDASLSCSIFTELMTGDAQNWMFVLPHCSYNGSKGVVIKLYSGTTLAWDGRLIRHNTSVTALHADNHTFGLMYGSCR
jgi:hypothetical protein